MTGVQTCALPIFIQSYKNGSREAKIFATQMGFMVELFVEGKIVSKQMSSDEYFCERLAEEFTDGYDPEFLSE